jgi:hypothetical protein
MNLFELQERLKDFSQDQLVREMQAPTGTAPQYLVLSELQRRQRMMAQEQAQMPQDQTTVAQDAMAAAGMPQGGLADMAQAMAPRTDMDMNTGVAPVERMQDGGSVDDRESGFIRRLLENIKGRARNSRMTDEEIRYLIDNRYAGNRLADALNPGQSAVDAMNYYREGDYPGAVINAASATPLGKIAAPVMNVIAELYSRAGDRELDPVNEFPVGMAKGGVVRMQPGGLTRHPQQDELDAALARLDQAIAMLGTPTPPALSGVSRNLQSFMPGNLADPSMGSDISSLLNIDPLVSGTRSPSRPAPIRPTDAQPILNERTPPSFSALAPPATVIGAEQGPRLPAEQGPGTFAQLPRFVRQGDEVFVQMEDGSLVPPALLGISDAEIQGLETEDLSRRDAFDISPFPAQSDLDLDFARRQREEGDLQAALDAQFESDTRREGDLRVPEGGIERLLAPRSRPPSEPWREALYGTLPGMGLIETVLDFAGLLPEDPGAMMDRLAQEDANKIAADRAAAGITDASDSFGALFTGGDEEGAAAVIERARDINRERFGETTSPPPPDKTPPAPRATPPAGGAPSVDDAFEQDKWLALAQAGLALMSSQQPTLGGAIGEAGLTGISALRTARGERDDRIEKAQARADRLAAAASRGTQYPYRQARDLLSLADAYDGISEAILAANSNVMPSQNDPSFRDYHINRILAEQIRADVAKMALGTGMTQGSEDED